jgi:hypothetical protein
MQEYARSEDIKPIREVLPVFETYLRELKSDQ